MARRAILLVSTILLFSAGVRAEKKFIITSEPTALALRSMASPTCKRGVRRLCVRECVEHTACAACYARSIRWLPLPHVTRKTLHVGLHICRPRCGLVLGP